MLAMSIVENLLQLNCSFEFFFSSVIYLYFCFSPLSYLDPANAGMLHMFVLLVTDKLKEYTYDAYLAGLKYNLKNTKYGLKVSNILSVIVYYKSKCFSLKLIKKSKRQLQTIVK